MKTVFAFVLFIIVGCAALPEHEAPPAPQAEAEAAPTQRGGNRAEWIDKMYDYCNRQEDVLKCVIENGIAI